MHAVIIRAWTKEGYHLDIGRLDDKQVRASSTGMEATTRHVTTDPIDAIRLVIDPKLFPEAMEFEVIVERH